MSDSLSCLTSPLQTVDFHIWGFVVSFLAVMSRSIYWRLTIPQVLYFKAGFVLTHEFLFLCMRIAVHFWAPTFKWGISIANIADFSKPPEKISYPQQMGMKPNTFFYQVIY